MDCLICDVFFFANFFNKSCKTEAKSRVPGMILRPILLTIGLICIPRNYATSYNKVTHRISLL